MASSINKVVLIGNLGRDPEVRTTQEGKEIANFNLATTDSWKDKQTGEKRERVEWHKIVVFSPPLIPLIKKFLKKGSRVYIEGALQTRKWTDQNGTDRYTTEVVIQNYSGNFMMLDSKGNSGGADYSQDQNFSHSNSNSNSQYDDNKIAEHLDDEIPF